MPKTLHLEHPPLLYIGNAFYNSLLFFRFLKIGGFSPS